MLGDTSQKTNKKKTLVVFSKSSAGEYFYIFISAPQSALAVTRSQVRAPGGVKRFLATERRTAKAAQHQLKAGSQPVAPGPPAASLRINKVSAD